MGKQSHKGGCPQEALILFDVTVLVCIFCVQLVWGVLKDTSSSQLKLELAILGKGKTES